MEMMKENKVRHISEIKNETLRKFIFRFSKAMFFYMSLILVSLMTYTYCNWATISLKNQHGMDSLFWLIITSAIVGVFIFIASVSAVFDDYKKKVNNEP